MAAIDLFESKEKIPSAILVDSGTQHSLNHRNVVDRDTQMTLKSSEAAAAKMQNKMIDMATSMRSGDVLRVE